MEQPQYFPDQPGQSNQIGQSLPDYRPTLIHRLPQSGFGEGLPQRTRLSTRRILLHMLLLGLTMLTTLAVGTIWFARDNEPLSHAIISGAVYSFTIIMILAAHEMGHYIAARWYGVDATLPYFIPMPLPPVGTFGAFIKIKSPIPNKRALFDIGIAGPLAGFVFAVPAAFIAHYFAAPAPTVTATDGLIYFQSPLLFKFFEYILKLPPEVELNPVMWAAWVGVFMTSLNLLPVGQLDGGHVTYAVFGSRGHKALALICYLAVILLAAYSIKSGMWNWVVYAAILTLMIRIGHPPVLDESVELGTTRKLIAIIGLLVFILCFMPFPISFG